MIALFYQLAPALFQIGFIVLVCLVLLFLTRGITASRRKYAWLAIPVFGAIAVWGVLQLQKNEAHFAWEQEVKLADGGSIWIKRETTFGHFGELAQIDRAKSLGEDFEFVNPKTGELIRWDGQYDLEPLLLDFDAGIPYLATEIKPGKHYAWGCPPHPYAFFKFRGGKWDRIGIKAFPSRFERSNVFPYLDDPTRKILDSGTRRMDADFVEYKLRPPMPESVGNIDRRIVIPTYFCSGSMGVTRPDGRQEFISVDTFYGKGTGKRLGQIYGWNDRRIYLSEQEAAELGIVKLGDEK